MYSRCFRIIPLCFVVLAGCSTLPGGQAPEEVVAARAQARMDALMAADYKLALTFYSPGYREVYGPSELARRYAGVRGWKSVTVDRVVCAASADDGTEGAETAAADRCRVFMTAEYVLQRQNLPMVRPRQEDWLFVAGDWYIETP